MADDIHVIDLTCKGCGQTMVPEKQEGVKVVKMEGGGLMFMQSDEPQLITCPYCGKSFAVWKPGPQTASFKGNGFSGAIAVGPGARAVGAGGIMIEGNVTGSVILTGNGNRFG